MTLEEMDRSHDSLEEEGVNWNLALGLTILAGAMAFLFFDAFESETYFYTVDQAVAQGPKIVGQRIRVKGTVEPGSIQGEDGELGRVFRISEAGKSMRIAYDKAMPDTFDESREVVVDGTVEEDLTVQADEVLVKCPSRYEGQPPTGGDYEGK
jgi:cytochrome c-type biogenesis protein CcmE